MVVYLITGPSGKKYVGCTQRTMGLRVCEHRSHHKTKDAPLYEDMRKMGFNSFTFEILAEAQSVRELFEMESRFIEEFDSFANGYNQSKGGKGAVGAIHSDAARLARAIGSSNTWENPITRAMRMRGVHKSTSNRELQKQKSAKSHAKREAGLPLFQVFDRSTGNLIGSFRSCKKASDAIGVHKETIRTCLKNGSKNKKFMFAYTEVCHLSQ